MGWPHLAHEHGELPWMDIAILRPSYHREDSLPGRLPAPATNRQYSKRTIGRNPRLAKGRASSAQGHGSR